MKVPDPRYSIIVPAFDEQARLRPTLDEIVGYFAARGEPYEVIVVDDGSRDATGEVVETLRETVPAVRLIRLPVNHGKGFAVRTGMVNARGDLLLFTDADGATPISEIERLERALEGADIAIGSRVTRGDAVSVRARWYRRVIGRVFHALVKLLAVRGFDDTQCGFKLFRAAVAEDLFRAMRIDGFGFDVEILLLAKRRGYRVIEVPVNWSHQPGSRIRLVSDSARMLGELFRIRGYALRGAYAAEGEVGKGDGRDGRETAAGAPSCAP